MKFLIIMLLSLTNVADVLADGMIKMINSEMYGFSQPVYTKDEYKGISFNINAIAKEDDFPLSSSEQGSIYDKIFNDLAQRYGILISLKYYPKNYMQAVQSFERGENDEAMALFGVYYKEVPYSNNQYVYPAFFNNDIHVIFTSKSNIRVENKSDLKNYRGIHVTKDELPNNVNQELSVLGVKEVEDFPEAYEELLTGKADYLVASYYRSIIEAYKLGVRNYIIYSINPIWKIPMFIRVTPRMAKHPKMEILRKYLRSSQYQKIRDDAFEELIEIYKESTKGVIPPTYINEEEPTENINEDSVNNNNEIEKLEK